MLDCLKNIVGISNTECECVTTGLTPGKVAALKLSTSGLYTDQLPGGISLAAISSMQRGACKDMADIALQARDNAITMLENDLVIAINGKYQKGKQRFTGQIGRMSFAQSLPVVKTWQSVHLRPIEYSDTIITVKKLQVIVNQNANLTVKLFRAPLDTVVGEEIGSYPVSALGNSYTNVNIGATLLKLPAVVNGEVVEYYFAYDTVGTTVQPKDNGIQCSSCNGNNATFSKYINVYGEQFDSPNLLNNKTRDTYSRGFIIDVDIACDNSLLFCREYNAKDAIGVTMAHAVWYKTGELIIEAVLANPDPSRYTTSQDTYLWGKRNHFRKEYEDKMLYIEATIDVEGTNCYICREGPNQLTMATIFA